MRHSWEPASGVQRMGQVPRRNFLIAAGVLLATPCATLARQPDKVARIGFLALDLAGNPRGTDSFVLGLRELGYDVGRNIVIEYRDGERRFERLPALAAELVGLKVDVIVAPSVLACQAAKRATRTIPIVFAGIADPVSDGLVVSLGRPGGNVTGLANLSPELVGKRLELLKEVLPGVSRIAILWQPGSGMEGTDRATLKDAEAAARALSVQLRVVDARGPAELDQAFAKIASEHASALLVLGTPMFYTERQRVVGLAARNKLPAIYTSKIFVEAGGLMAYGASLDDLLRRSATYVDKLLKGARASDLPVEQPTKFEFVVNAKTAKALGLTIPQSVLGRVDAIVQ